MAERGLGHQGYVKLTNFMRDVRIGSFLLDRYMDASILERPYTMTDEEKEFIGRANGWAAKTNPDLVVSIENGKPTHDQIATLHSLYVDYAMEGATQSGVIKLMSDRISGPQKDVEHVLWAVAVASAAAADLDESIPVAR